MRDLKIKICGMRDPENIRKVAHLGPELMGFVFYPDSPRFAGYEPVKGMFTGFSDEILKTGVFVDMEMNEVNKYILNFDLDAVQLHGDEKPEYCHELRESGLIVLKAFRVGKDMDFDALSPYMDTCDWFLFDTFSDVAGGSGKHFDWKILENYKIDKPFFLSGGIGPEDAESIRKFAHPQLVGIDINSRFEKQAGLKDLEKLKAFLEAIRK